MSKTNNEYTNYVLDQLDFGHLVDIKKMFGGIGLYYNNTIFGIIFDDITYLKVNDNTRAKYKEKDSIPFRPFQHRAIINTYYSVPDEDLLNKEQFSILANEAIEVASKNR